VDDVWILLVLFGRYPHLQAQTARKQEIVVSHLYRKIPKDLPAATAVVSPPS
jgi:hypothetical protein